MVIYIGTLVQRGSLLAYYEPGAMIGARRVIVPE